MNTYTCGGCKLPYTSTLSGPDAACCPRCNPNGAKLGNRPVPVLLPEMQAWEDWIKAPEARAGIGPIRTDSQRRIRNLLWYAFMAGFKAGRKNP
jgi:hypothetical protein